MVDTLLDPVTRALANQLVDLQREVDLLKRSGRTTQLQSASLMGGGSIPFYDGDGVLRMVLGQNSDGGYSIKTMPPPQPPPRPNTPDVVPFPSGLGISWNGEFVTGSAPSDFKQIEVYVGSSPTFIAGKSNFVGVLTAAGGIPVAPLDPNSTYYAMFIATNTSEKPEAIGTGERVTASTPSLVASGVPARTVAQEILDGIVTDTKLAAEAVGNAALKVKAIDGTKIADNSISSPLIIAESILAGHIALNQIQADHMTVDSITAREIRALSILSEHIMANVIDASHIKAGSITATKLEADLVIAKRILAGDPIGARIEMHPTDGLQGFTAAGVRTFWISALTGSVNILGSFQAGTGADRVVIQDPGDGLPSAYFYAVADPVKPAYINAVNFSGRNGLGLNSGPSADSGTSPVQSTLILQNTKVRLFNNCAPGHTRGNNAIAGGFIQLEPTGSIFNQYTDAGVITAQLQLGLVNSWLRTVRSNGQPWATVDILQSGIFSRVVTSTASPDGGYSSLARTGSTTYFGHQNGSIDHFIQFDAGGVYISGPGPTQLLMDSASGNEVLLGSGGNNFIRFTNNNAELVKNGTVKAFVIPHPTPEKSGSHYLVHGCTESPVGGVEYWGEAHIANAENGVTVLLPDYFEDLCALDMRNVQVTQVFDEGDEMMPLFQQFATSPIVDGKFNIYTSHSGPTWVNWVVKARRKDINFYPEPHRSTVKINGNGPYRWVSPV